MASRSSYAAVARAQADDPVPRAPVAQPVASARGSASEQPALSIGRVEVIVENPVPVPEVYAEPRSVRAPRRSGTPAIDRFRLRA